MHSRVSGVGRAVLVTALAVGISLATDVAAAQAPASAAKPWSPARLSDGQPDVQGEGFWSADIGQDEADDIEQGSDVLHAKMNGRPVVSSDMIVDPPDHRIPYTPAAAAIKNRRYENRHNETNEKLRDPIARCLLAGVPRFSFLQPFRIIQNPGHVLFLYQYEHAFRVVPLDGRPHIEENIKLWRGDSRGRWEGNTLVVDVTNNDARTWFDQAGAYHSDALHVVERFAFVDANTINYEATLEDPKAYTRPWKIAFTIKRTATPGFELWEDACYEGHQAAPR